MEARAPAGRVVAFAALVLAIASVAPVLGGDPTRPGTGFAVWLGAPATAGLLVRGISGDRADLGLRLRADRAAAWFLLGLVVWPAAVALALAVGSVLGASSLIAQTGAMLPSVIVPALVVFAPLAFAEELGWRGYLAPAARSLGLPRALDHVLVAAVWWAWHLPYATVLGHGQWLPGYLARLFVGLVAASAVLGEVRLRSRSLWPSTVMRWIGMALVAALTAGFVTVAPGRAALGSVGHDGLVVALALGGVAAVAARLRSTTFAATATGPRTAGET